MGVGGGLEKPTNDVEAQQQQRDGRERDETNRTNTEKEKRFGVGV